VVHIVLNVLPDDRRDRSAGVPLGGGGHVDSKWILLGVVAWALGLLVALVLFRMAGDQDRAARHNHKQLIPHSDVTITKFGNPGR